MANSGSVIELLDDDDEDDVQVINVNNHATNHQNQNSAMSEMARRNGIAMNQWYTPTLLAPPPPPPNHATNYQNQNQNQNSAMSEMARRNGIAMNQWYTPMRPPPSAPAPSYYQQFQNPLLLSHPPPAASPSSISLTAKFLIPKLDTNEFKPHEFARSTPETPVYLPFSDTSSWQPSPTKAAPYSSQTYQGRQMYKLSLISVSEFTVQGKSLTYADPPSVAWMRIHIKKISKNHGKAVFERIDAIHDGGDDSSQKSDNNQDPNENERDSFEIDGGRWRIPLGAYQSFYSWLSSKHKVEGIPPQQLKIASLGKQRRDREYPSSEKLIKLGVPRGLAWALAPYQRGGVDFVIERGGKALIADEMGLGKSIQAIASMTVYEREWPLLILCPSSARYHWEAEVKNWLGKDSAVNDTRTLQSQAKKMKMEEEKKEKTDKEDDNDGCPESGEVEDYESDNEDDDIDDDDNEKGGDGKDWHLAKRRKRRKKMYHMAQVKFMKLILEHEVHVVTHGKDFWRKDSRAVITSYDIAIAMIKSGRILPDTFKCVIVDESHMIKNLNTQRTKRLIPILKAAPRCILLSGTPAFARPIELYPQLSVLGSSTTEGENVWENYDEFVKKYCKGKGSSGVGGKNLSELHTLLISTVMIRRKKIDILKTLPSKVRERAYIKILDANLRQQFREMMLKLKTSKGQLGKLARENKDDHEHYESDGAAHASQSNGAETINNSTTSFQAQSNMNEAITLQIQQEISTFYQCGKENIERDLLRSMKDAYNSSDSEPDENRKLAQRKSEMEQKLLEDLNIYRQNRLRELSQMHMANFQMLQPNPNHYLQQEMEEKKRESESKRIVSDMYNLTGIAKVPVILAKLKRFIDDPSKGKLCIFAHHMEVLNRLERESGIKQYNDSSLESRMDNKPRYIRIDGSTNAKLRHKSILAFQSDPKIRIAFLGITAAGVAVTLTAASTVWFAELFWTPAIMIQAEDRCHRIGQTAEVKCLYMIGRGTLDEVIWKLIEKKFRSLGEFVEGNSKSIDLHKDGKIIGLADTDEEGEEEDANKKSEEQSSDLSLDGIDISNEITELAGEEQAEIKRTFEDLGADPDCMVIDKPGSSEGMAICLSDDEGTSPSSPPREQKNSTNIHSKLKLYKISFAGKSYELVLHPHEGRVVVHERLKPRIEKLGEECKPHVGDVLIAIEDFILPYDTPFNEVVVRMRNELNKSASVELTFCENTDFISYYKDTIRPEVLAKVRKRLRRKQIRMQLQEAQKKEGEAPIQDSDIIELSEEDAKS